MKRLSVILVLASVLTIPLTALSREEAKPSPCSHSEGEKKQSPVQRRRDHTELIETREQFKQIREMAQRNRVIIRDLEGKLFAASSPEEREDIQRQLDEALKHRAVLRYTMLSQRAELARQSLEMARSRLEQTETELEQFKTVIQRDFPDLDLENLPDLSSPEQTVDNPE